MLGTSKQIAKITLTVNSKQLYDLKTTWAFNEWIYKLAQQQDGRKILSDIIGRLEDSDDEIKFYFKLLSFNQ